MSIRINDLPVHLQGFMRLDLEIPFVGSLHNRSIVSFSLHCIDRRE